MRIKQLVANNKQIFSLILLAIILSIIFIKLFPGNSEKTDFNRFPLKDNLKQPIHILYFFFGTDCDSCVQTIEYLNNLNKSYKVTGIVFDGELDKQKVKQYGIKFEVRRMREYERDYIPWIIPSVMGVFNSGVVFFLQPGFPCYEVTERLINETVVLLNKAKGGKNA